MRMILTRDRRDREASWRAAGTLRGYAFPVVLPYRQPGARPHEAARERRAEMPDRALNATIIVLGVFAALWLTFGQLVVVLYWMTERAGLLLGG